MPSCPLSSADIAQHQTTSLISKEVTICRSKGIWQKPQLQTNIIQQQLVSLGNGEEGMLLSYNLYAFNPHFTFLTLKPFPTSKFACRHPPKVAQQPSKNGLSSSSMCA